MAKEKVRVVIVEDVSLEAKLVQRTLADAGYSDVVLAPGLRAAEHAIDPKHPTVLITDINLGSDNGLDLVKTLRGRHDLPYVYAIAVTGRATEKYIREAFEAGADDFIAKPLGGIELLARLRAASRIVHLERELRYRSNELEGALRKIDAAAVSAALARARQTSLAEQRDPTNADALIEALPWEPMRDVIRTALSEFFGTTLTPTEVTERPAGIVAEVLMVEPTRQVELATTLVVQGDAAAQLARGLLGDDVSLEDACTLILEGANVVMGALKSAFAPLGFALTGGLPTSPSILDARAAQDAEAIRQRFALTNGSSTIEVWIRVLERRNARVRGKDLKEGHVLADDVRDKQGMLLVRGGVRLTASTATRLQSLIANVEVSISVCT